MLSILIIISAFWLKKTLEYELLQALMRCLVVPISLLLVKREGQGLLPDFHFGVEDKFTLEG